MSVKLTPSGSRGFSPPNIPRPLRGMLSWIMNASVNLRGGRILTLTTVGSKSGKEHQVPLRWFPDGDDAWLIVASYGGAAKHPAWYFNLARNPDKVWIKVNNRTIQVQPQSLAGAAYDKAWSEVVAQASSYNRYQQNTDRQIPIVRLVPKSSA